MIGRNGERGSGISALAARHDDDDIYIYIYISLRKAKIGQSSQKIYRNNIINIHIMSFIMLVS